MTDFQIKEKYNIDDFRRIMEILRAPGGCPWDAEQTHESIRRNAIEEAYELAAAIDAQDEENLKEELGDLLMQVIFHARIEEEKGRFNLDDVADAACKKLVFRHPHVFGDVHCENSEEVLKTWDEVKRIEKDQKTVVNTMEGVAETLPALWRAEKIQKKASVTGFDTDDVCCSFGRLKENMDALELAVNSSSHSLLTESIGELLFAAVSLARKSGVDPEMALHHTCEKQIEIFRVIDEDARLKGIKTDGMPSSEIAGLYTATKDKIGFE